MEPRAPGARSGFSPTPHPVSSVASWLLIPFPSHCPLSGVRPPTRAPAPTGARPAGHQTVSASHGQKRMWGPTAHYSENRTCPGTVGGSPAWWVASAGTVGTVTHSGRCPVYHPHQGTRRSCSGHRGKRRHLRRCRSWVSAASGEGVISGLEPVCQPGSAMWPDVEAGCHGLASALTCCSFSPGMPAGPRPFRRSVTGTLLPGEQQWASRCFFIIDVQLTYKVVLVPGARHSSVLFVGCTPHRVSREEWLHSLRGALRPYSSLVSRLVVCTS